MRARAFAILASAAGAGSAAAERAGPEEVVELRYEAPPECPTREAAIGLVRERTTAARFDAAGPAARVFEIRVTAGARGYTGALVVDATADKQLTAERCDDLVTALALVIALAIDPAAAAAPLAPPASPPAPEHPPPRDEAPPARPRPIPRPLDGALSGLLGAGLTPDLLLAGSLAARAAWPALALELAIVGGRDTTDSAAATATFTRITARPAACRLVVRRGLELGGCGHLEIGAVHATGDGIINGRELTRLWLGAGAHGTLRWPGPHARAFAQLQLGATVPITRDRYRFMPEIILHDTPPITGWLALGVGLRLP